MNEEESDEAKEPAENLPEDEQNSDEEFKDVKIKKSEKLDIETKKKSEQGQHLEGNYKIYFFL